MRGEAPTRSDRRRTFRTSEGSDEEGNKAYRLTTRPPVTARPLDERRGADEELFRFTDRRRTFRTSKGSDEEGNKAYRQGASRYKKDSYTSQAGGV